MGTMQKMRTEEEHAQVARVACLDAVDELCERYGVDPADNLAQTARAAIVRCTDPSGPDYNTTKANDNVNTLDKELRRRATTLITERPPMRELVRVHLSVRSHRVECRICGRCWEGHLRVGGLDDVERCPYCTARGLRDRTVVALEGVDLLDGVRTTDEYRPALEDLREAAAVASRGLKDEWTFLFRDPEFCRRRSRSSSRRDV